MTLHTHRYAEVPAPPSIARTLLAQPPIGAVRFATYWHWLDELWAVESRQFADDRIVWSGACAAIPNARFLLTMALHDSIVTMHAEIHLSVDLPGGFWTQRKLFKRINRLLDHGLEQLREEALNRSPAPRAADDLPPDPAALAAALRPTHPATVAAFETMDALPALAAVARLDRRWQATEAGAVPAGVYERVHTLPATIADYDLIYAGGGLGVLHAAVMARCYGYRVLLFDRDEVGCAHREWNISDRELAELIRIGLFTTDELESVVMCRYRDGVVRFWPDHSGVRPAELHMPDVLNVALDAAGLLQLTRRKLEAAGGMVLDYRAFKRVLVQQPGRIAVEVAEPDGSAESYGGRVLIDGMGAASPLALVRFAGQPFAGVCPTVGTVVEGLEHGTAPDQHNPDVGDILVSVADAQRDRQLIWEGFAGRGDELTIYVFYYDLLRRNHRSKVKSQKSKVKGHRSQVIGHRSQIDQADRQPSTFDRQPSTFDLRPSTFDPRPSTFDLRPSTFDRQPSTFNPQPSTFDRQPSIQHSLLDLFEDYFRLLPSYKRPGPDFKHLKPVYGFIPARHTVRRQTVPLLPGVLPVGDSSAQQSPLTFCGFGSHVRNLDRTTSLLDRALRHDLLEPEHLGQISAYQANVALNWVFSRFMQPWRTPRDVNRLQNVFARVLNEVGVDHAVRFFQDQMTWRDYGRIVNHTLRIYKPIIPTALRVLGPRDTARWIADWLRFSGAAATAALGRRVGNARLKQLTHLLESYSPAWAFRLAARRAEWRAMGWEAAASGELRSPDAQSSVGTMDHFRQPA